MSEYDVNKSMVDEAKSILNGLRQHQKSAENKLSNMDKQIEDLKLAQRKMEEAVTKSAPQYSQNDDSLRRYIRKDGSLQLKGEKRQINLGGNGSVTTEIPGLLDEKDPSNEWHAKLLEINRKRNFARKLMVNPHTPKLDLALYKHIETAPRSIKPGLEKAYTGGAGAGQEWTQDEFVTQLYESYTVPRRLRSLLPVVEVDRGSLIVPTLTRGGTPYVQGTISTDDPRAAANLYPASTVTTSQAAISITGQTVRFVVDQAAAEDSALALASILSRNIAESIESGFEDCMINGDAAGGMDDLANWSPHSRWAIPASPISTDHRRAFNGWRKLADSKASRSTPSNPADVAFSDVVSAMAEMGEYAAGEKIMVVSPSFLVRNLLDMSQLATIDKFGPMATVLVGTQIGSLLGMPVIMSRFMTSDLNASGVFDNVTKTQTGYIIYNRDSYVQYLRRGLQVETQRTIASGSYEIVASLRSVMGSADSASAKNVAFQYNIDG